LLTAAMLAVPMSTPRRRHETPWNEITCGRSSHANRAATRVVARSAPTDFSYLPSRSPPFEWDVVIIGKYR
jgi:hypothetical protein